MPERASKVFCTKRFLFVALAVGNLLILGFYQGLFSFDQRAGVPVRAGLLQTRSHNHSALSPPSNTSETAGSNNPGQSLGIIANVLSKIRSIAAGAPIKLDVHKEDPLFGHTGDSEHHASFSTDKLNIAIGGGITTRKVAGLSAATVGKLQFFTTLLPSFCRTVSPGYHYHFYLGYDDNDGFFSKKTNMEAFQKRFQEICDSKCSKQSKFTMHFVQCTHNKRPAWAQNDAMFEAYIDGADYYYRVNDDSDMVTKGWTEAFIKVLEGYKPTKVGVVGPKHRGGNEAIMTYDFTHRTHLDIFGHYYPRLFTDWWADDWVTKVYLPGRSTKLKEILLTHTMRLGQRYNLVDRKTGGKLKGQLEYDQKTLQRYVKYRELKDAGSLPEVDGSKIISMSLWGKDTKFTYGAIRNAQLTPVIYPGWRLRIYIANKNMSDSLQVPSRILLKLKSLGAELVTISGNAEPKYWRYLVADDDVVKEFLIRDCDARIGVREKAAVDKWISSSETFHFIKDHPKFKGSIPEGLWGARRKELVSALGQPMNSVISQGGDILRTVIWPSVTSSTLCHDSVSCTTNSHCKPFPSSKREEIVRRGPEYVGMTFTQYMEPAGDDYNDLKSVSGADKCVNDG